jgi:hypothetical protein
MEILFTVSILTGMVSCPFKRQNQTMAEAICQPRSFPVQIGSPVEGGPKPEVTPLVHEKRRS